MASFNADIDLKVKVLDAELTALEKRIQKISKQGIFGGNSKQFQAAQKRQAELEGKSRLSAEKKVSQEKFIQAQLDKRAERTERKINAILEQRARIQKRNAAIRRTALSVGTSGVISAAFPLITGGNSIEAALGGIGGALGGLFGGLGGFAGGIAGTAIGRLISEAEELDQKLVVLNGTLGTIGSTSAITSSDITQLANQLNIAKDETIELAAAFNSIAVPENIPDLIRAFGPEGQQTAEAIAQARLSEADALKSIDKLAGLIGIENAENLRSVVETQGAQAASALLLDTVLEKQRELTKEAEGTANFWDRIAAGIFTAASGQVITPEELAQDRVNGIVEGDTDVVQQSLDRLEKFLRESQRLQDKYKPKTGGRAPAAPTLPESQALQLSAQLTQELAKQVDIKTKYMSLFMTETDALKLQNERSQIKLQYQSQALELQRQQALASSKYPGDEELINQLYDKRLTTLIAQNELFKEQNNLRINAIQLEEKLLKLKQEQTLSSISTDLNRQIEAANLRSTGNTQFDEQLALRIKQIQRQEDVTRKLNDAIAEQNLIIDTSNDIKKVDTAEKQRNNLQAQLDLYNQLLPQLNAAEQAQLRYNQVLQAAQPYAEAFANGLTQGLRDVVAGTKTAEEAFADFLNNIADLLIQTAATMIAQYIAIGIAKAFAGLSGGSSSGFAANPTGTSTNFIGSGLSGFAGLAEGSYVSSPTPALVGEGGEPEYVIPQSKMDSAMSRWGAGQSGGQILADGGEMVNGGGGTALADQPPQINISGGVMQVGGADYVRMDQIPSIIAQSAKAGEAKALRSLQMSPSARRMAGV